MQAMTRLITLTTICLLTVHTATARQTGEPAKNADALLAKMSQHHGGRENWLTAPALQFSFVMHLSSLKPGNSRTWSDSWRNYQTTIDPDTSRSYVDVPFENRAGFEAGFDGRKLWQTPMSFDPDFQDNAMMLSWYHYSMMALPFLAAADGAEAVYTGQETLLDGETAYDVVTVSYAPLNWNGDFDLFLDPETGALKAWRQGAMAPPLPGSPVPGLPVPPAKILRVVDTYQTVAGLTIPRQYVSYSPAGDLGGVHMVTEFRILESFDDQAANAPEDATVIFEKPRQ